MIHGIDLEIKEGQMVALVRESGSGKSTLAKLLVHFYDLDSGRITLGGQNLTDMSIESLNDQISFVFQEQFLFNTSLYDNILIGKPGASREEVLRAASLAQCDEFLERLPGGIDSMAGEGGKMLSGGERQRISLARALLKDAPVIVLDEATAFIDPETDGPEIEFKDVSFGYDEREVLKNVSLSVPKDSMTALVGPSGSGKTTIANLLPRFWDIRKGAVLLRGKDIREVPLADLMDHISMVFQRVYLFKDTVYNNIAIGRMNATREEVEEAARKARCYDFIMQLPDGFDTVIGEGGASLSGGEQQRISIARCILKDAPIVILDEATASVDADNESYIQTAISELVKGKTLLVIAHRLNTIEKADQILVVYDGQIAERGTHKELMAADGLYHNMVTKRSEIRGFAH